MLTLINKKYLYHLLSSRTPSALNRAIQYNFKKKGINLTQEQSTIMGVLWNEDGLPQQALADATYRDKPSTTRIIDNLEKEGMVKRIPSPTDRRSNLIYLTSLGKELELPVIQAVNETLTYATRGMKDDQIQLMKTMLQHVFNNLNSFLSNE